MDSVRGEVYGHRVPCTRQVPAADETRPRQNALVVDDLNVVNFYFFRK